MQQPKYVMKVAARLSGLSPYVIRSWEKRYGVVSPERTDTNRRLYTEEHVEHLRLLRRLTEHGHAIGSIAELPVDELRRMVEEEERLRREQSPGSTRRDAAADFRDRLLDHARALDPRALEQTLLHASSQFTRRALLEQVIVPFVEDVGRGWLEGRLRIAHEHVATTVVRNHLLNALTTSQAATTAPTALVATPQGQIHELGALMIANVAAMSGWDIIYLGADLPAEEIASSARDLGAAMVLLSIVFPPNDPRIQTELTSLARMMPDDIHLVIGGRSAAGYRDTLQRIGAEHIEDIDALWKKLSESRFRVSADSDDAA